LKWAFDCGDESFNKFYHFSVKNNKWHNILNKIGCKFELFFIDGLVIFRRICWNLILMLKYIQFEFLTDKMRFPNNLARLGIEPTILQFLDVCSYPFLPLCYRGCLRSLEECQLKLYICFEHYIYCWASSSLRFWEFSTLFYKQFNLTDSSGIKISDSS